MLVWLLPIWMFDPTFCSQPLPACVFTGYHKVLAPHFLQIHNLRICEILSIKDTYQMVDTLHFERECVFRHTSSNKRDK